jgi:hypothetical protein
MESRLIVDLSTGHLEVTGSEELVKHIFNEFRAEIASKGLKSHPKEAVPVEESGRVHRESTPKKGGQKKASASADVNKDLDTSGVEDYFDKYDPKSDAERAMIFVKFLTEQKELESSSIRDVYTCFFAMKSRLKLPNMASLLSNDYTRTKFFTQQDGAVMLTRLGETHFSQKLKKKATV